MKIAIDARWIFREMSGIGSYTRELIRHLALLDCAHRFVIYFSDPALRERTIAETELSRAPNFTTALLPFGLFSIPNQLRLPRRLAEDGLNVFHSPNYMIPLRAFPRGRPGPIRCVTTIHDLIPLMFPAYTPRAWKRRFFPLYRWLMREVAARANLILTDSQSARADVLRYLRAPPQRVLAIPLGVLKKFQPLKRADWAPGGGGAEKTILWVGRADPYKNLVGLIEAFAALLKQYRLSVELHLVGPRDQRYPEAQRSAVRLGISDAVKFLGYLPDDRLVSEYQQADLFVQPSWYEGFGLPVLEAFACGVPVICSNKGALPEVAGSAALTVQPQDTLGLTEAMRRLLTDFRLARDLAERGVQQAQKYTWEATARQTLAAYEQAASL
ncbi:MAG: glycosyltransferase family 4 protein [Lentisphaerae bacterium]|nr:glycosyltransferase family 4 protein [Lentisphaerota bacterium]